MLDQRALHYIFICKLQCCRAAARLWDLQAARGNLPTAGQPITVCHTVCGGVLASALVPCGPAESSPVPAHITYLIGLLWPYEPRKAALLVLLLTLTWQHSALAWLQCSSPRHQKHLKVARGTYARRSGVAQVRQGFLRHIR